MAITQQRRPDAKDPKALLDAVKASPDRNVDPKLREAQQKLEKMDDKTEMSQDTAAQLQAMMGNAALAGLLNRGSETATSTADAAQKEAQEEVEEEGKDEGEDLEQSGVERVLPSFTNSAGTPGGSPFSMGHFFGGDDDGEGASAQPAGARWRPMPSLPDPDEEEPLEEVEAAEDGEEEGLDFGEAEVELGEAGIPEGMLQRGLRHPYRCALPDFSFERLVDLNRLDNAYGRGNTLLRLLATWAEQPDAKLLATAASFHPFAPEGSGFSGAITWVLALCELVLLQLPDRESWEPLFEVGLDGQTRPQVEQAAERLAPEGRLNAPAIVEFLVGERWEPEDVELLEEVHPAAAAVLARASFQAPLPLIDLWQPPPPPVSADPELEAHDAHFLSLFGEEEPTGGYSDEALQPVFDSMNALLGALGLAQAEVATAALAVSPWAEVGQVAGVCSLFDDLIKKVARRLVRVGRELEDLVGTDDPAPITSLSAEAMGVRGSAEVLRRAAFCTLGAHLRTQPPIAVVLPAAWEHAMAEVAREHTGEARKILEEAIEQAEDADQGRLSLLTGAWLLHAGFGTAAEGHLGWAAALLEKEEPHLAAGALLLLLSLRLSRGQDVGDLTDRLGKLGRELGASMVVAAAAIGELQATERLEVLQPAAAWMRTMEEGGALNLLKGRYAEWRLAERRRNPVVSPEPNMAQA